jgi:hypothetical protein
MVLMCQADGINGFLSVSGDVAFAVTGEEGMQ